MTTIPPAIPPVISQRNKFQELARASWIAPLIGIGVNILMVGTQVSPDSKLKLVGSVFCIIGFLCGLIAICGIPKFGKKGIIGSAIAGLSITGLMIFLAAIGLSAAKKRVAQRQEGLTQAKQEGMDAFLDYPGWLGKAQISNGIIVFASINELSEASREYNTHLGKNASMVSLTVNNLAGTDTLIVDPSSLQIVNADGSKQRCLNADEIYASTTVDRDKFIARFSGLISVPPGRQSTDRSGFFATGTDFSKAVAIIALVNGQEAKIIGQYFTPQQKKDMFKQGKQIQK